MTIFLQNYIWQRFFNFSFYQLSKTVSLRNLTSNRRSWKNLPPCQVDTAAGTQRRGCREREGDRWVGPLRDSNLDPILSQVFLRKARARYWPEGSLAHGLLGLFRSFAPLLPRVQLLPSPRVFLALSLSLSLLCFFSLVLEEA